MHIELWQALLIGLVAAMTQLDGLVFGEAKLREPIVTGFLVGLILGDVSKGLIIGAQMQLIWMGTVNIGPTAGVDVGTGSTIGAAVAIATGTGVESAIMFGVPVSVIMQFMNTLLMTAYSSVTLKVDTLIDELKLGSITMLHWLCAALTGLVYFSLTFALMFLGGDMIDAVVTGLPGWVSNGLNGVAAILPALGFALLMNIIMEKPLIPYFILGFIPVAFVGHDMNMVGMAAVAVAIALIIFQLRSERTETQVAVAAASDDEWED